jgi:hypothetical protein
MPGTFSTPLMNLELPVSGPGGQVGPTWANNLNTAFQTVDSHDHTNGKGALVPVAGMNINTDFPLNGYNILNPRSTRYQQQASALSGALDKACVYVVNGNLFYNNGSGTAIQLTAGSGLNAASIGGIGGDYTSSSASVAYSSVTKTFSFTQSSGISAKIAVGDISITETVASANAITIKNPTGLGSSYSLTLPSALPGSQLPVLLDASGNLSTGQTQTAMIADGAVTTAKIAANAVTRAKMESVGQVTSSQSPTSWNLPLIGTEVNVPGLSATITSTGRPIMVVVYTDWNGGFQLNSGNPGSPTEGIITLVRNLTTNLAADSINIYDPVVGAPKNVFWNPKIVFVDAVAAGTHTYTCKAFMGSTGGSPSATLTDLRILVYEL